MASDDQPSPAFADFVRADAARDEAADGDTLRLLLPVVGLAALVALVAWLVRR